MSFRYALRDLTLSGGSTVSLPDPGLTLIVGPNNVGKSQLLRELRGLVSTDGTKGLVAQSLTDVREGSLDDFGEWIRNHFDVKSSGNSVTISGVGVGISWGNIPDLLDILRHSFNLRSGLAQLGDAMLIHLTTADRLNAANPVPSYKVTTESPANALQILYRDEALEARLSASFARAFDCDLVLDRLGGSQIALHCGQRPDATIGEKLSIPYACAVQALPRLDSQGDGMRSYVACLLHTDVVERRIVLIDEPEAFLHPPQARMLAQHLARSAKEGDRQIVLATHSSDVVRGALDGGGANVSVVRLTRKGQANFSTQLDATRVRLLWEDPLLRASNLLDALFHRRLVLCESDGDCRFYNATLEAMSDAAQRPRPDVMFAHTNGKNKLPTAVSAMAAVGVPVSVIADIDVLDNDQPLRGIWEGLGGEWAEIAGMRHRVAAAVEQSTKRVGRAFFREQVLCVIEKATDPLDEKSVEAIRSLTRGDGGWRPVKHAGVSALPAGDVRKCADELLAILRTRSLHVVAVGELEGFVPSIGGHGPAWVEQALRLDLANGPEAATAREFVASLRLV
jgi:energy-coupling factor transporter ATP-binding protein EcfA2